MHLGLADWLPLLSGTGTKIVLRQWVHSFDDWELPLKTVPRLASIP